VIRINGQKEEGYFSLAIDEKDLAYSQTAQIFSGLFCICAGIEYVDYLADEKYFRKYFYMERRCV
jgi:hypothetical protein